MNANLDLTVIFIRMAGNNNLQGETMKQILKDLYEEFKTFYKSKGVDAILPPLVFVMLNNIFGLFVGIFGALSVSTIIGLKRILKKEPIFYALGGILGVVFASVLVLISKNAVNYFLPKLLSSGLLLLLTLISLMVKKPIAMIASHLTRSFPIKWYKRADVYPAYLEVTWIWLLLFLLRFSIIGLLILKESLEELAIMNILLGTPFTIFILTVSYVYGIYRLGVLRGPSVDEFIQNVSPPWKGQKKGF